jgi:hypothetical protein
MNSNERAMSVAIVTVTLVAMAAKIQSNQTDPQTVAAVTQLEDDASYAMPTESRRTVPGYSRPARAPLSERTAQRGPTVLETRVEEIPVASEEPIYEDEVPLEEPYEEAYVEDSYDPDVVIDMIEPMPEMQVFNLSDQEVFDQAASLLDGDQRAAFMGAWVVMSPAERRELLRGLRSAFSGF